jgi:HK97 gp10 family phage protein
MAASNKSDVTWVEVRNDFPKIIKGMEARASVIVRKAALDIQSGAQRRAPVDTGTLRASIQAKRISDTHWEVWVGVDYGIYLEYGTVNMAARPYLRPAVAEVADQFRKAMRKVVTP